MSTKYTEIDIGCEAMVRGGYLYVRTTSIVQGMLVSGGYADRVRRMPYTGTLEDAQVPYNDWGITNIDRCVECGEVVRKGRLIQ